MSAWSLILFLLAALYVFGAIFEFPIMFDGNPKTRWLMKKIGKRNLKIVFFVMAVIFIILAMLLR
jgi:Sec-independent protein secretion pathway component TatC